MVFAITVTNTGAVALNPVPLTDTFDPAKVQFQSASITPDTTNANSLVWTNVGPLGVGGSITITTRFTAVSVAMLDVARPGQLAASEPVGRPDSAAPALVSNHWKTGAAELPIIGNVAGDAERLLAEGENSPIRSLLMRGGCLMRHDLGSVPIGGSCGMHSLSNVTSWFAGESV